MTLSESELLPNSMLSGSETSQSSRKTFSFLCLFFNNLFLLPAENQKSWVAGCHSNSKQVAAGQTGTCWPFDFHFVMENKKNKKTENGRFSFLVLVYQNWKTKNKPLSVLYSNRKKQKRNLEVRVGDGQWILLLSWCEKTNIGKLLFPDYQSGKRKLIKCHIREHKYIIY